MKNIKIFVLVLVLLLVPTILATESISKTSFWIRVYNNTIEIISNEYTGNNQNFTFGISNRNDTVGNSTISVYYVPLTELNYTFLFVRNISVDMSLVDKWANCINETSICKLDAAANFTQCSIDKTNKDNDITNKQTQINTLTKEKTDTQNQKFLFALGGAVIAVLVIFAAQGKLRKKVKERSEGEFNKNQAR